MMPEGVQQPDPATSGEAGVEQSTTMSFASVAAMAPVVSEPVVERPAPASLLPSNRSQNPGSPQGVAKGLERNLAKLAVRDDPAVVPDIPEVDVQVAMPLRTKLDDEKTHLSSYSATAPSLDGKSVASGTTFGLDEKESLRPDDSASVKATEDDDSNSGPASGDPNSRVGSEAGLKAFTNQFTEISDKMPPTAPKQFHWARKPGPGAVEELRRSALASQSAGPATPQEPVASESPRPDAPSAYEYQSQPDDKLLEAMESPKDRLFLLQLEQDVIAFIQDSTEPLLNLPPCNSFYRLLAHRLGDYYALSHFVDNSVSHVKLYRTPYCRLRTTLSEIAQKLAGPVESRPVLPSMKIMRRSATTSEEQGGSGANTTEPSVGPSNTGSDAGDESTKLSGMASPADSLGPKEKAALSSRELREAKYKEARDRIFRDFKEGDKLEPNPDEGSAEGQTQNTAGGKKKKKNRQLDDSFDSRSSYNLYYRGGYRPTQMFDQAPVPMAGFNGYMQQPANPMYQPMFQQPYQQYPQMPMPQQMPNYQVPAHPGGPMAPISGIYPPHTQGPQNPEYGPPLPGPYYNPYQQSQQMAGQPASLPSPANSNHSAQSSRPQSQMSDQGWNHGGYHNHHGPFQGNQSMYPTPPQPQGPPGGVPPHNMHYPYGQLPYQPPGAATRPAHPVPGSYNRQNFNPQSRVFIPGQFDGTEPRTDQYHPSMNMAYHSQYQPNAQGSQMVQMGQMQPAPSPSHSSSSRKGPTPGSNTQSPGKSSLSKWGTPANLPPKPPPPAMTDEHNDENRPAEQPRQNGN